MLDIKFIRENKELVKKGCRNKGVEVDIDRIIELDKKRREMLTELEKLRAEKNKASKIIASVKSQQEKKKIISEMKKIDKKEDALKEKFNKIDKELNELLLQVPNLPLESVPVGKDESENVVLREVGKKPEFNFPPRDYLELAQELDLIDIKRAAKVAGTRFGFLKKEAVLLEFALINFAFDQLIQEGFIPLVTPVMIKPEMMRGMGYVERGRDEIYYIEKDNLYLAGTTEQIIGAMHAGEIFEEKQLPIRYVGFSTWFRREAGSYGRETWGIFRVHQFDGVEMFSFAHPEKSVYEHQFFLSLEERLMKLLKIPYRVVEICTGDLGDPAAAKYDIEAWMPSQGRWRETHSTSNCTDFQARRLNIRYKDKKSNKLKFVHTLNGTAFAIGRTLIAIIENYQQKDGSIKVPSVLRKYLNFSVIKKRKR
ncbi:serine--tRNA ligase [bacterium]|nr:serine--tRNA ligase [bacterium]